MAEVFAAVAGIAAMFGVAAVILWLIEALVRFIGAKQTAILLLGVVPTLIGAAIAYLNRASLQWWEFVLYPLAGPLVACGVLVLGCVLVLSYVVVAQALSKLLD